MDVQFFDRLWIAHQPDQDGMADFWNKRAPSFNAHKNRDAEAGARRRSLIRRLARKAGLGPGGRALDIGCGTGHYALLLAEYASEVTGLDIAPRMIEFAGDNAEHAGRDDVRFEVADWGRVDVRERGWEKRFDLVLAAKTPAVNSREALLKMMAASRGSCCLISHVDIENSVRDQLRPLVDWDEGKARVSRTFYCAFNILWLMGHYPEVWYMDQEWDGDIGLDDALMIYIRSFESIVPVLPDQREAMRDKLAALAVDGRIRERVRSRTAVMFWKV